MIIVASILCFTLMVKAHEICQTNPKTITFLIEGVANSTAVLGHTLKAVLIFYSQILNLVQVVYPQCEQQIFSIVMSLCLHFDSLQLTLD